MHTNISTPHKSHFPPIVWNSKADSFKPIHTNLKWNTKAAHFIPSLHATNESTHKHSTKCEDTSSQHTHTHTPSNILHKHSTRYPFAKPMNVSKDPPPQNPISPLPISLHDLKKNPLLSNIKPSSKRIRTRLAHIQNHECTHSKTKIGVLHTAGRSAHQANRDLRKILI